MLGQVSYGFSSAWSPLVNRAPGITRGSPSRARRPASAPAKRTTLRNGSGPIGSIRHRSRNTQGPLPPNSSTTCSDPEVIITPCALNSAVGDTGGCQEFAFLPPSQGAGKLPAPCIAEEEVIAKENIRGAGKLPPKAEPGVERWNDQSQVYFDITNTIGYSLPNRSPEAVCHVHEDREKVKATTKTPSAPSSRRVPSQRPASAPARGRTPSRASSAPSLHAPKPNVTVPTPSVGAPGVHRKKARSSKSYLREHRLTQEAKDVARDVNAKHNRSAALYEHLCHMSEANALAEDLGIQTRYRPHKRGRPGRQSGDYEVVCHVYEGQKVTEVSLTAFERRFKALQGRWSLLSLQQGSRVPGGGEIAVREDTTGGSKANCSSKPSTILSEQEQEALQNNIKRVTLETLALADRMYQQLDIIGKAPTSASPFVIH